MGWLFDPIIVDELKAPDIDFDAAVVLSDWNDDANGGIEGDFTDPVLGGGSGQLGAEARIRDPSEPSPVPALANKTQVVQAMRLWGYVARHSWEPYWRDTILIQPSQTVHMAFVVDNRGKWPLESAIPDIARPEWEPGVR